MVQYAFAVTRLIAADGISGCGIVLTLGTTKLLMTWRLTAVVSLALGIGANTAIYSFMDAIMLRALPVKDPGELAILNWRTKNIRARRRS